MILDKVHEIISFKQSKYLENSKSFITQKRNEVKNKFERDFYQLLNNTFHGKAMEQVGNCLRLEFILKNAG